MSSFFKTNGPLFWLTKICKSINVGQELVTGHIFSPVKEAVKPFLTGPIVNSLDPLEGRV